MSVVTMENIESGRALSEITPALSAKSCWATKTMLPSTVAKTVMRNPTRM